MTVDAYLADFCLRHSADEIVAWLDKASKLCPAIIGDAILDEYLFCKTLGVSSKDPTLAVLKEHTEMYAGGALAVANHLAGLCDSVRLVTRLGEIERYDDFIARSLRANVNAHFLTQTGAPTICKTRIVDSYSGYKLLELYCMDDMQTDNPAHIKEAIADAVAHSDMLVVSDFGHGLLPEKIVSRLWASGKFLAVNAQSNAGNRGYNPISKYRHADYICIANHEVDEETRQKGGDDKSKLLEVTKRIACPRWTVTRGKYGTLHYDLLDETWHEAPALATKIIDRVGAGDAVFAVTSLLARLCAPWDVLAFIGNVTGACAVEVLGNQKSIDREALEARIRELMKG
jgi:bifunctional ADP-heptose synthase (sugar kinase/adenylyltransferase)